MSDWKPRQRKGVWLKRGRTISLRDSDGTKVCVLNDTAAALWELCDGATTTDEMALAVSELFAIAVDRATVEVKSALEDFRSVGAVS